MYVFNKETDSKQYLMFVSCYPRHTRSNIPFNLARRTVISDTEIIDTRLKELQGLLLQRHYSRKYDLHPWYKEKGYLTNFKARESLFYGLLKVHNSPIIKTGVGN